MDRVGPEEAKMAAVLHDVVEDTPVTLGDLRAEGFPETVVDAVEALTKRQGESYEDFILRAAANEIARTVKLADLLDNCDLSRIPSPAPEDWERLIKYRKAIETIKSL
jgi:(p)ppGpp synthase/HD superfamily hydrolase